MTEHTITYTHEPTRKKILAKNEVDEVVGEVNYSERGQVWTITHTVVRPAYRGGDIAFTLIRLIVEAARVAGVKLKATCPYALKVLNRTTEYHDVFNPED